MSFSLFPFLSFYYCEPFPSLSRRYLSVILFYDIHSVNEGECLYMYGQGFGTSLGHVSELNKLSLYLSLSHSRLGRIGFVGQALLRLYRLGWGCRFESYRNNIKKITLIFLSPYFDRSLSLYIYIYL